MNTSIHKAILVAGGQSELARRCGLTQSAVSKWARGGLISAENALLVQAATKNAVTVHDLRPDVFGPAPGVPPLIACSPSDPASQAA
jgi:DNA-binding transcriptional regulator YdaS (Cro superfamily)